MAIKHIGRVRRTGAKVVVVFKTIPGEPKNALVLGISTLSDIYHDALMQLLEDVQGQQAAEFGDAMASRFFPDGRNMLQAMHLDRRLQKIATADIDMTPTHVDVIPLDQLNELIAEQKGIKLEDLAVEKTQDPIVQADSPVTQTTTPLVNEPLTDQDLARQFRSQADAMFKEAQALRKQADDLDPPVKKAVKKKETASA
jgi:hypothetical protein